MTIPWPIDSPTRVPEPLVSVIGCGYCGRDIFVGVLTANKPISLNVPSIRSFVRFILHYFSGYGMGRQFFVSGRTVKAGEELFLEYVPCDRRVVDNVEITKWMNHVPITQDYKEAAEIAKKKWAEMSELVRRQEEEQQQASGKPDAAQKDGSILGRATDYLYQTWTLISKMMLQPPEIADTTTLPYDNIPTGSDIVRMLLPKTYGDLKKVVHHEPTTPWADDGSLIGVAKHALHERSVEWIQENGMCLENMIVAKSNIPQAGNGGIAQFAIARGDMVVPAPLLHLDRSAMPIYDQEGNLNGTQLLMNYCLGHPASEVLLFPITNAIVINHCSNRGSFAKYCPDGPNAAYRWSSGWDASTKEWKKLTVPELLDHETRGLAMEVVALRDIKPGTRLT